MVALAALAPLVGGLGSALGGALGGTKIRQTTLTATQSLNNSFTPTNAVTLGGDFGSAPYAPVTGNPATQVTPTLTPPDQAGAGVPNFFGASSNSGGLLSGNMPLYLALGAGAIYLMNKG